VDLGVDGERFTRCLDERRHADAVEADVLQARALGITATPTFVINGIKLVGAHPVEAFRSVIADELKHR
jgi:predicted DsbA family dithiol-disulfide isomerase